MQVDIEATLAYARLSADLLHRENVTLTPVEYFQLWHGLEKAVGDREIPLLLAQHISVEAFEAPMLASICSSDLNMALARIQQYKPLIGPLELAVNVGDKETALTIRCYGHEGNLPKSLALTEAVFFTQLSRLATREDIKPTRVVMTELPDKIQAYQQYFGCNLEKGLDTQIAFSANDARRPFLTANLAMWQFFESGLNKNLANINTKSSTVERLRAVFVEMLPAGYSSIDAAAEKLAMSKRTLQRKLAEESETYHSVLQLIRTELADHYLKRSQLSLGEISFLLGYQESNSFIRAFSAWKGVAPGRYRVTQLN